MSWRRYVVKVSGLNGSSGWNCVFVAANHRYYSTGNLWEPFNASGGGPLSPLTSTIAADVLTKMIKRAKDRNLLKGVAVKEDHDSLLTLQ